MYKAHVVSHTHWDREWYNTFQQFRMRLVDLTDALIDLMERNEDFKYFTFDGQTIVLEDYIKIRPENEDRLRKLIMAGRIIVGPWYNQPDEFLVSGESIIRNLMLGKKLSDSYGSYLASGYVPDCFGHMSQFPQILRGFGIDNAVLFRGVTTDQVNSEFCWRSPDGSEVLTVKMPDNNAYSNFFYRMRESLKDANKPLDADQVANEVQALTDDCIAEKPTTSNLLFMDGCDHVFAQFKTPEIIKIANERLDNVELTHTTLEEFVKAVRAEKTDLQICEGELRMSNRDWKLQGLLGGVMSSRIHLKQANHYCETLLEKYVEPLCSWIWMMGGDYPKSYIDLAWKYLLQNSPHDSICGCSIDQVHKDMIYRFDQTKQIGESLKAKALAELADKVGSTVKNCERSVLALVFNPLSHVRTDVVETEIDLPIDWPCEGIRVIDPSGTEIPSAMLNRQNCETLRQTPYDIPGYGVKKVRVLFVAKDVPSVGYKAYRIEALEKPNRQAATMLLGPDTAENEFISITIGNDGTFYLLDKETDAVFSNCLIFEDGGDFGDGWNYVKPIHDRVVTSLGAKSKASVIENNAVRVVFEIETELELPKAREGEGRSLETVTCIAKTQIAISSAIKRVDIRTSLNNNAKDHRLRVLFPSGLPAKVSHAESAFDVVARDISVPICADWREPMETAHPQKSFVDVSGAGVGLTVINKGLPQYEVKDDEARTVALTLLRAVGNGVRAPEQQVEGQVQGNYTFEYALYPHAQDWEEAESFKQAHSFNVPLAIGQSSIKAGAMPYEAAFVEVNEPGFVVSAVKRSEDADALIVRGFNIGTRKLAVKIKTDNSSSVEMTDLNENPTTPLKSVNGTVSFEASPKKIVTCKIKKS